MLCDNVKYFQETTVEQELFCRILQILMPSPYVIRREVETVQKNKKECDYYLPTARFDLVASRLNPDNWEELSIGEVVVNTSLEEVSSLVSSKTDTSFQRESPSMFSAV